MKIKWPPRGFTLIELLVVIAIIGLLSAIVLASLNSARTRGVDAAVKSNLSNARPQGELFYDANGGKFVGTIGSTDDVCSASGLVGEVKGVYSQVKAAADAAGVPLSTSFTSIPSPTQAVCHSCRSTAGSCDPKNAWAAQVPLRAGGYYCVDSSGYSGAMTDPLVSGDTSCL